MTPMMTTDVTEHYSAYKDAGILGRIPAHWDARQLGRLGRLFKGNGGTKVDEAPEGIPCIRYGDIYTQYDSFARATRSFIVAERAGDYTPIRYGDVLFAASGETLEEIGKSVANLMESHACCGGDVIVFRPSIEADARYLGYAADCANSRLQKSRMGHGMTVMHIYHDQLKRLWIAVPPREEQSLIADFLDHETERIDTLVAKKRRLIELLQEKRTALITRVVSRGLDVSAPIQDTGVSSIGPIPAHWTVRRLRTLSPSLGVGVVVNPSNYVTEEGVPFLYGSDVTPFHIDVSKARRMSPESSRSLAQSMIHKDDLVTVRVGDPGVTAVVPASLDGANCASMMIVRRSAEFDSEWLCYVMNSRLGRSQVEMVQYGAAQKQFNIGHAVDFRYPVPPLHEQIEMVQFLDHELESLKRLAQRTLTGIDLSTEYRSALITAAVAGQIDVRAYRRDPEEVLEAS